MELLSNQKTERFPARPAIRSRVRVEFCLLARSNGNLVHGGVRLVSDYLGMNLKISIFDTRRANYVLAMSIFKGALEKHVGEV